MIITALWGGLNKTGSYWSKPIPELPFGRGWLSSVPGLTSLHTSPGSLTQYPTFKVSQIRSMWALWQWAEHQFTSAPSGAIYAIWYKSSPLWGEKTPLGPPGMNRFFSEKADSHLLLRWPSPLPRLPHSYFPPLWVMALSTRWKLPAKGYYGPTLNRIFLLVESRRIFKEGGQYKIIPLLDLRRSILRRRNNFFNLWRAPLYPCLSHIYGA